MTGVTQITDPKECARLWRAMVPQESLTDLWEVRDCFQRQFKRPPLFVLYEEYGRPSGLLPLSWIAEAGCYGCFPGETWNKATWLEQNRIIAPSARIWEKMLAAVPGAYRLRYLRPNQELLPRLSAVDEVGYIFEPPRYEFNMERYWEEFSHKHQKQVKNDVRSFEKHGPGLRLNRLEDVDLMIQMNLSRFGAGSYFHDVRFQNAFRDLAHWLHQRGMLRLVTLTMGGEPAAIDLGCLYNGMLTVLAGGVDSGWPGVAKLINLHHLEYACQQRLREVDFLCGSFNWKKLFHLGARPLYSLSGNHGASMAQPAGSVVLRS